MKKLVALLGMTLLFVCSISTAYADLNEGLVAYYPLDGNVNDLSGNGNHGTKFGGPSYAAGVSGSAVNLDGVDDYVNLSGSILSETGSFSVFFKPNTLDTSTQTDGASYIISNFMPHAPNGGARVYLIQENNGLHYGIGAIEQSASVFTIENTQDWIHVVATWDNGLYEIYVNNNLVDTANYSGYPIQDQFAIGAFKFYPKDLFRGLVDEVRFYNRVLQGDEVEQIYHLTDKSESGSVSEGLVAYYPFDGTVFDLSGNGIHGHVTGSPGFVSGVTGEAVDISLGNYVRVSPPFVPGSESFSIAFDFYVGSVDDYYMDNGVKLFTLQGGDWREGVVLVVADTENPKLVGAIQPEAYTSATKQTIETSIQLGEWHSIALVVNKQEEAMTLYVDGLAAQTEELLTYGSIDPTMDMLIGAYDYVWARPGHAQVQSGNVKIDNFRIYNRNLEVGEVLVLSSIGEELERGKTLDPIEKPHGINEHLEVVEGVTSDSCFLRRGTISELAQLIDPTKQTYVFVHGWRPAKKEEYFLTHEQINNPETNIELRPYLKEVIRELKIRNGDPNVIVWNWEKESHGDLPPVKNVGPQSLFFSLGLAELFEEAESRSGLSFNNNVHFIGQSLGAGVVVNSLSLSNSNDYFYDKYSNHIERITLIDPPERIETSIEVDSDSLEGKLAEEFVEKITEAVALYVKTYYDLDLYKNISILGEKLGEEVLIENYIANNGEFDEFSIKLFGLTFTGTVTKNHGVPYIDSFNAVLNDQDHTGAVLWYFDTVAGEGKFTNNLVSNADKVGFNWAVDSQTVFHGNVLENKPWIYSFVFEESDIATVSKVENLITEAIVQIPFEVFLLGPTGSAIRLAKGAEEIVRLISGSPVYVYHEFNLDPDALFMSLDYATATIEPDALFYISINDEVVFQKYGFEIGSEAWGGTGLLDVSRWAGVGVTLSIGLLAESSNNVLDLKNLKFYGVEDCGVGDPDGDGLSGLNECTLGMDPNNSDSDLDGFDDGVDNCPLIDNPDQLDSDGDGLGDACSEQETDTPSGVNSIEPSRVPILNGWWLLAAAGAGFGLVRRKRN